MAEFFTLIATGILCLGFGFYIGYQARINDEISESIRGKDDEV